MDYTNFASVLLGIASGTVGVYWVGRGVSYLAENWPKWHTLPREVKFFAPIALSILLAYGATLLLQQTALIEAISPWWSIAAQIGGAWIGTQDGYMATKRSGYAASVKTPPQG